MRFPLSSALALIFVLMCTRRLSAQSTDAAQVAMSRPPDHSVMLPLTTSSSYTYLQTGADGKISSQREETVAVNDSQGRRLSSDRVVGGGATLYTADDPLAGRLYVWNSAVKLAKALVYAEPTPGRRSCWKLPQEELVRRPEEPSLNLIGTTCMPAESPQSAPYCKAQQLPVSAAHDFPLVEVSAPGCASILQGQTFEDLGSKTIRGFEAHGCRITGKDGSHVEETWWMTLTSGTLTTSLPLSNVEETRSTNGQTLKTVQEITAVQVREPDPSLFKPPADYEIKTVTMQAVACNQALPSE